MTQTYNKFAFAIRKVVVSNYKFALLILDLLFSLSLQELAILLMLSFDAEKEGLYKYWSYCSSIKHFLVCAEQTATSHDTSSPCHPVFGYLIDKSSRRNVSICSERRGGHHEPVKSDENLIYVSQSNHIQLVTKGNVNYKSIIRLAG
jgi:hypothetical protein